MAEHGQPPITEQPQTGVVSPFQDSFADDESIQVAGAFSSVVRGAIRGAKKTAIKKVKQPLIIDKPKVSDLDPPKTQPEPTTLDAADNLEIETEAERLLSLEFRAGDVDVPFQTNFDVMETTDDIKALIQDTAERNVVRIQASRGPIQRDVQVKKMAQEMGLRENVMNKILQREFGDLFEPKMVFAARQIMIESGERLRDLAKLVRDRNATDLQKLQLRRQFEFHSEYLTSFMGFRAQAGRTLHAFGIPAQSDKEGLKRMSELVETMQGRDVVKIAEALEHVDTIEGINKLTGKYQKSKALGVLEELFINSILSGMKTQVVNFTGNALFQVANIAEHGVAAQIGRFFNDAERVEIGEASALLHGMTSGWRDTMKMTWKAFKSGQSSDRINKFELSYPKAISADNLGVKAANFNLEDTGILGRAVNGAGHVVDGLGTAIRFPTERGLTVGDELFKSTARRADLARQAYRNAMQMRRQVDDMSDEQFADIIREFMENSPTQAIKDAETAALYQTFQNPLGPTGRSLQGIVNKVPGLKFVTPFIRTPVNLFKAGLLERSPLAFFTKKFRSDIAAGGAKRDLALARASMGSMTTLTVATGVASGFITGGGPSDFKARQLKEATGWRPYSLFDPVTNKYRSYARAEPFAFVIGATADAVEIMQWQAYDDVEKEYSEEILELSSAIIAGVANNTMSKTFMQGMSDFFQVMDDPGRYMEGYFGRMTGAIIPFSGLRRDLSKIQDPILRQSFTLVDKLRKTSGIPGWSEDAPPSRDPYGDIRYHPTGTFLGVLSPFPMSSKTDDPVKLYAAELMQETRRVPISRPSKKRDGVELTAWEYDAFLQLSRKIVKVRDPGRKTNVNFHQYIANRMRSSAFRKMTPDAQVTMIKEIQLKFDQAAWSELLDTPGMGELSRRVKRKKAIIFGR